MIVVSVASQARASIAAKFNLTIQQVHNNTKRELNNTNASTAIINVKIYIGSRKVGLFLQEPWSSLCF